MKTHYRLAAISFNVTYVTNNLDLGDRLLITYKIEGKACPLMYYSTVTFCILLPANFCLPISIRRIEKEESSE